MRSCEGTYSIATPFTLLLIPSTPGVGFSTTTTTTPTSTKNLRVYLIIAISTRVNIVYKWVAKVVKDIRAIDYRLSRLKDFLSKIKDKLAFIRRSITILIYNARLPDIELK